jgi:Skp family chaperone for outer membrane proteins
MKRRRTLIVVMSALGLLSLAAIGPGQNFVASPSRIAVVDLEEVWKQVEARQEMIADLQGKREELLREREKREKKINNLKQDLDWLPQGSDDQRKKIVEVEEELWQFQAWRQFQENKLVREEKFRYEDLYRITLEAIEEVAKTNQVDVVFFKERTAPNFSRLQKTAQVLAAIGSRKVLYAREDLDLTDQVIVRMNNK